jgi:RNA polymerase sigma-70 factor (ECF subfamily)
MAQKNDDCRGGSRGDALADLYRRYWKSLHAYLARRTNSPDDAADLAQEAYARLARSADFLAIRSPRAFLFRTALNLLIDQRRAGKNLGRRTVILEEDLRCERKNPEEAALASDASRLLAEAIEALPPKCRRVFVLHKLHSLSYAEIEIKTGIRPRAIEKHILRGMLRVQQHFESYVGDGPTREDFE